MQAKGEVCRISIGLYLLYCSLFCLWIFCCLGFVMLADKWSAAESTTALPAKYFFAINATANY